MITIKERKRQKEWKKDKVREIERIAIIKRINHGIMKISKETWKDILKIVGTIIATIASVLGVQAMPL